MKFRQNLATVLTFLAFWFFTNSCLTVNKIQRNCDKFATVCITGTGTEIVYRDTTIYLTDTITVTLPRDTVTITDTVKIINNRAYLPPVYKQFGLIGVTAGVNANLLNVRAWLTDSTILVNRIDTVFLNNAIQEKKTTNTLDPVKVRYIPTLYKIAGWFSLIVIVITALWIAKAIKAAGNINVLELLKKLSGKHNQSI